MRSLTVAAVALLLVVSLGTLGLAAGGAGSTGELPHETTSVQAVQPSDGQATVAQLSPQGLDPRWLSNDPDRIDRSEIDRTHVDLGPSIEFSTRSAGGDLANAALEQRIDDAETEADRRRLILDELSAIEAELETMKQREAAVLEAYGNDEIAVRTLFVELGRLHQDAGYLDERLGVLEAAADDIEAFSIDGERADAIEAETDLFQSPVREYSTEIATGSTDADRLFAETTGDGYVITAVDGGEYLRETLREDRRAIGDGTMSPDEVEALIAEQYPELWEERTSVRIDSAGEIFRVHLEYDGGQLQGFVDSVSEELFKENRRTSIDGMAAVAETNQTQSGLDVTVQQTHVGGPLEVTVSQAGTDQPADATVTVALGAAESEVVGNTDDDGVVLGLEPRGTYTIAVLSGTNSAFVELESNEPKLPIGEDEDEDQEQDEE